MPETDDVRALGLPLPTSAEKPTRDERAWAKPGGGKSGFRVRGEVFAAHCVNDAVISVKRPVCVRDAVIPADSGTFRIRADHDVRAGHDIRADPGGD
ncbi:hypothetical protein [Streptantibioticus silvisoli]|uniref:Uncharacterized protein n=1 Tax=Streptantibioticus silvisoli TaxID=2705255 RepID=A0ABT6VXQ9_9ACTN|nr:hypothetical protein [Streptantibioticus silvisoli]MDI5963234.1 hypothetical protein [Streptantibioticus silvisoli]